MNVLLLAADDMNTWLPVDTNRFADKIKSEPLENAVSMAGVFQEAGYSTVSDGKSRTAGIKPSIGMSGGP
jgi:hypothetical protein